MLLHAGFDYPDGQSVDFYGIEVIEYYLKRFLLYYGDYSINIRLLYGLILVCIIAMMVVFVLFALRIRHNRRHQREFESASNNLREGFYEILTSDIPPTVETLEKACNVEYDVIMSYRPQILSHLISEICMDLSRELGHIPNSEPLCELTGVKQMYEENLTSATNVLLTLQNIANMHVIVKESLLAVYINHHDNNVKQMARICYALSSTSDPYRYFKEDLNTPQGVWRIMMLHRLFSWLWANDRQMPQFLVLSEEIDNEDSVAFLIEEVAYWGTDKEKASLHTLFLAQNYRYRKAALRAVAILRDKNQEQAAVDSFDKQPDALRQDVLNVVAAINSGNHTDFFVHAYRTSLSKKTREVALTCLYSYGTDGRRTFEMLRGEVMESATDRALLDQIDSMDILNQMRTL